MDIVDASTIGLAGSTAGSGSSEEPISHGQRALWFLYQLAPDSVAYNIAAAIRIRSPLDVHAARAAFQTILDRHDVLRSTFRERDGEPIRVVAGHQELAWQEVSVAGMDVEAIRERMLADSRRPFDLTRGPLFRVFLYTRAEDDHFLMVNVHHIVFDARSAANALEEFLPL